MSIGFPDYQRGQAAASPVLINTSGPIDTFHDFGAFAVSAWPFVSFIFDTSLATNYYYVEFRWNNSLAQNDFITSDTVVFGPGWPSQVTLPVRSPYCQIHVVNLTLTVSQTITIFAYGSTAIGAHSTLFSPATPLISINQSIAAAGSATFDALPTVLGEASVFCSNTGTETWDCHLSYYDLASKAFKTFWQWASGGGTTGLSMSASVKLPSSVIRLVVHNSGASAHTFIAGVTVL